MSEVSFGRNVACGRERIDELLVTREFLARFVELQHPVQYEITVGADESSSTIVWVVSTDGLPGIFRGKLGRTVPIRLVVASRGSGPDRDGVVQVDLEGKVTGRLRASLSLLPLGQPPTRTAMTVRGPLTIDAGLLSGKASSMARDHVILPILGELADLFEEWCDGPPA